MAISQRARERGSIPVKRLLGAYAIVILGAGHGAAPAGLLLYMGAQRILRGEDMLPALLAIVCAGWLGVLCVGLTAIPVVARRARWLLRRLLLLGVLCLLGSVVGMVAMSEVAPITAATALPFAVVAGLSLWRAARGQETSSAPTGESVS